MQKNTPILTTTLITGAVAATLILLSEFGVPLTDGQQVAINGLVAILAPAVIGGIAYYRTTANENVVEVATPDGEVVAGPANEIETGEHIRALG